MLTFKCLMQEQDFQKGLKCSKAGVQIIVEWDLSQHRPSDESERAADTRLKWSIWTDKFAGQPG